MTSYEAQFDYEAALQACARGERPALQRLYQQESARLLGVVLRIVGDRARAEDIVHDAFLRVWSHAHRFDPQRGSARGWIFTLTRRLALNHVRTRHREVPLADDETATDVQPLTDTFAWQVNPGRLQHCLEQLEPVRRNCVCHAYVDGYTHQQIAARVGAPLGTVKAWIKRSLAALRECMG